MFLNLVWIVHQEKKSNLASVGGILRNRKKRVLFMFSKHIGIKILTVRSIGYFGSSKDLFIS